MDRPSGTSDYTGERLALLEHVEGTLLDLFRSYGYAPVRAPAFETFSLVESRYGEHIRHRLFTFYADRDYVLRPDVTGSICRMVAAGELGPALPLRVCYAGECFRYEQPAPLRLREFRQLGVELVGSRARAADVEVVDLVLEGLGRLGLAVHTVVRLGHVGLVRALLARAPEADAVRVLHALNRLEHLATAAVVDPAREREHLRGLHAHLAACGLRAPELSEDPPALRRAWSDGIRALLAPAPSALADALVALCAVDGTAAEVRAALGPFARDPAVESALAHLEAVAAAASAPVRLAPALVRTMPYYSGITVEADCPALGKSQGLCGGGRYDGLIEDLGGPALGAVGFAFGAERLAAAIEAVGAKRPRPTPRVIVRGPEAASVARALRSAGVEAALALEESGADLAGDFADPKVAAVVHAGTHLEVRWRGAATEQLALPALAERLNGSRP